MPISIKPSCPSNYTLRDSYKTSSGKCSPSRCVRKTGLIKGKSSERAERSFKASRNSSNKALKMSLKRGLKIRSKCSKGQVLRKGYTRKSYNRKLGAHVKNALVAPGCITKRGKSTHIRGEPSTRIYIDENDHFLSEYGYHHVETKSKEERHQSLHARAQKIAHQGESRQSPPPRGQNAPRRAWLYLPAAPLPARR